MTQRLNFKQINIIFESKAHSICIASYRKLNYNEWTQYLPISTIIYNPLRGLKSVNAPNEGYTRKTWVHIEFIS